MPLWTEADPACSSCVFTSRYRSQTLSLCVCSQMLNFKICFNPFLHINSSDQWNNPQIIQDASFLKVNYLKPPLVCTWNLLRIHQQRSWCLWYSDGHCCGIMLVCCYIDLRPPFVVLLNCSDAENVLELSKQNYSQTLFEIYVNFPRFFIFDLVSDSFTPKQIGSCMMPQMIIGYLTTLLLRPTGQTRFIPCLILYFSGSSLSRKETKPLLGTLKKITI